MCQRLITFASVSASNGGFQRLIGYELSISFDIRDFRFLRLFMKK